MNLQKPTYILKRLQASRDAKRVITNFSYLSLLQIGSYVLPILTYPYLARVIGVEGFGKIAFAMSVIVYFMTITDWGYNFTATRDIAKCRGDKAAVEKIYSIVTTSKLALMLLSGVCLAVLLITVPYFKENCLVIALSFSIVVGQTIFPEWLFQGMERMKMITILNLLSKTLFTVLIFVFIHDSKDYVLQPVFAGLGYIMAGIISMLYIRYSFHIKFHFADINEVFNSIKCGFDVFLNTIIPNLYTNFSVLLLGFWGGSIANGFLEGANKFYSIGSQFLTILSRAFFPYLSRHIEKHIVYAKIKLAITILFSLVLVFGAPLLVDVVLGDSFKPSIMPLRILGASLIFHSITNIYGTNYLLITGKERLLRKITLYASLAGAISAVPLIYFFSYTGAACAIALSRVIIGTLVYFFAKKQCTI